MNIKYEQVIIIYRRNLFGDGGKERERQGETGSEAVRSASVFTAGPIQLIQ